MRPLYQQSPPFMQIFLLLAIFLLSCDTLAKVHITTSIKPIHSIASYLTKGISQPTLLLGGAQSFHHNHLKPTQLRKIHSSDLLIVLHPDFETGLKKTIANMAPSKKLIIGDINGINLLNECDKKACRTNYHLWLDTDNMQIFAVALVKKLSQIDRKNQHTYQRNLAQFISELTQIKYAIQQVLLPLKTTPLALFSDAFGYFVSANQLAKPIVVTDFHGDRLGVAKVLAAKNKMKAQKTHCLLSGSAVSVAKIKLLAKGLKLNTAQIDIRGVAISAGVKHYFALMNTIGNKVAQCLR